MRAYREDPEPEADELQGVPQTGVFSWRKRPNYKSVYQARGLFIDACIKAFPSQAARHIEGCLCIVRRPFTGTIVYRDAYT